MGRDKTIVWFRRDLRIEDNPALAAAVSDGSVVPVFIWCPQEEGQFRPGRVSRWWLKQSLSHLVQSFKSLGTELVLIKTHSTIAALLDCINAVQATKVVFNHLYDPISIVRDHQIKEKLVENGIPVQSFNGDLLHEPWEIYDEKGRPFTTFNAYWNKCLKTQLKAVTLFSSFHLVPAKVTGHIKECCIEELGLEDESEKSSNALLGRAWSPGWCNADKALAEFTETHLLEYSKNRLKVGQESTSLLSPYLHFGELSIRKVFQSARTKQILWTNEGNHMGEESVTLFLRAIGLREYSRYICFNFPFTHERPLLSNLKYFPWRADQTSFKAWRQGRTGYPLVDAGMRELWATGWMHNKIRIIVSSFAVKFLLLPWQWGMKYFWDTLLDADMESDILGWQYISGSLPDGHELERLDNPELQGEKFDPEGEYVRNWLPELARMPTEWIHHPWDAPPSVLRAAGIELGLNYPKPLLDMDLARERLTEAIIRMKENEAAAMSTNSKETYEEVVDNSSSIIEHIEPPRNNLMEKATITISSNDQKVPTLQNDRNNSNGKKRSLSVAEERPQQMNDSPNSRNEEDLCSTAESSSSKKQNASRFSFSVPQQSGSSICRPSSESESSDMMAQWQGNGEPKINSTCSGPVDG